MSALVWLRRDLRRRDLPTLQAAVAAGGGEVAVCFVLDPRFYGDAGPVRQAWLAATLRALAETYEGCLTLRSGDPTIVIPQLAAELGAGSVHVSTETEPGGAVRDAAVRAASEARGVAWVETGSPYAVTPGRVVTGSGAGFQRFTPFLRAWREHGWRAPAVEPETLRLAALASDAEAWARLDAALSVPGLPTMPEAGEQAAQARWAEFLHDGMETYAAGRNRPDLDGTSRLSPYLKFGVLHPRTLLHDLTAMSGPGVDRFVTELAWREFYADVLHRYPASESSDLRAGLLGLAYEYDEGLVQAWQQGCTGFPFVDAGMRQLLATGWMHNRVRMVTASFLTKDLHVWWPHGADWFMQRLIDGDVASNAHGWQWSAGTGTDAAPYFRVFNPVLQGLRFDPVGDYVRRWIPELAHVPGPGVHEPWRVPGAYGHGYPARIVDHDTERKVALERYAAARP